MLIIATPAQVYILPYPQTFPRMGCLEYYSYYMCDYVIFHFTIAVYPEFQKNGDIKNQLDSCHIYIIVILPLILIHPIHPPHPYTYNLYNNDWRT